MTWATAKNLKDRDPRALERRICNSIVALLIAIGPAVGLYLAALAPVEAEQAWREAREAKAMLAEQRAGAIPELVELGKKHREQHQ